MLLNPYRFGSGGSLPVSTATWDPSKKSATIGLSGGNLIATAGNVSNAHALATQGASSGKYYWEVKLDGASNVTHVFGVCKTDVGYTNPLGTTGTLYIFQNDSGGWSRNDSGGTASGFTGVTFAQNDIVGFRLDMTAGTLAIYKNNVLAYTFTGMDSGTYFPVVARNATGIASNAIFTARFTGSSLTYPIPSGYSLFP